MRRSADVDRPRRMELLRRFLLLSGIGLLAGCDARDPTAPAAPLPTAPPSARRTELGEPLGHTFLTVPANSSLGAVASITAQDAGSVPDSTWVVINVDGQITQTWNPDCDYAPPYWPCQTGPVAYPFGAVPSTGGPVGVWVQEGSGGGWTTLRGVGGSNSSSAVGLHFQTTAGGVGAKLNLQARWAWNPNTGLGPHSYSLSGGYDVNVTRISSPIEIDDNGVVDAAGTHSYSLRTTYGLQLINPRDWSWNWPAGAVHWYFFPGDPVSEKPGYAGPHYELTSCRFQTSCSYAPPGPGRVQADAYVETRHAMVRTRDRDRCDGGGMGGEPSLEHPLFDIVDDTCIVVEQPTLQVTCPDTVIRGANATCVASTAPATPDFTVTAWSFAGDGVASTPITASGDLKSWTFQPTECGTVTVTALVNGSSQSATARVEVCPFFSEPIDNDPILGDPNVLAQFRQLWRDSNAEPPGPHSREKGALIFRVGSQYVLVPYAGPSTRCESNAGSIMMPSGGVIVGFVHTHPDPANTYMPFDGSCLGNTDPTKKFADGPSTLDTQSRNKLAALFADPLTGAQPPVAGYVIDRDHLHRWSGGLPTKRYRRDSTCR